MVMLEASREHVPTQTFGPGGAVSSCMPTRVRTGKPAAAIYKPQRRKDLVWKDVDQESCAIGTTVGSEATTDAYRKVMNQRRRDEVIAGTCLPCKRRGPPSMPWMRMRCMNLLVGENNEIALEFIE